MLSAIERIIIIATPDITTYGAENAKVSTCLEKEVNNFDLTVTQSCG